MPSAEQGRAGYSGSPRQCKPYVTFAKATITPEGHTVHRLAGAFRQQLVGQHLLASSPQGRFTDGAAVLSGLRLDGAEAWGTEFFRIAKGTPVPSGDDGLETDLFAGV